MLRACSDSLSSMAEPQTQNHARFLNPCVLHLQKLGLELKCQFCLNLYNQPVLLPCNHIFCSSCVPQSNLLGSLCALCKFPYVKQELRQALYMEKVVNIYRSLDATFSNYMLNSDIGKVSDQCRFSAKANCSDQLAVGAIGSSLPEKLISEHRDITLEHEAVDADVNQVELSPDSPSSSGVSKGVETDSLDPGISNDNAEKCPLKKSVKRNADNYGAQGINGHDDSALKKQKLLYQGRAQGINGHDDSALKKQKLLYQGLPEMHEGHSLLSMSMNLKNPISTVSDINPVSGTSCDGYDSTSLVNFTCAFCQTWKITEASGPMRHFANGKQVFGSNAGCSNVIHVHKHCIDWAPQTFYESDNVIKNLNKELARSAKLKCTSCGLKGAALGCFAKSCRRSYHAPCAFGISQCRWDTDEFLMLCPSHTNQKFPSEKFRKPALKKCTTSTQIYDEQKSSQESDIFWAPSPTGAKNWVISGSALSADEKFMLVKFAKLCGATVTKAWNPNVTHVIAATDANGACGRTLKVLMAILEGSWILNTDWVGACMKSKCPVDEEPYEIKFDNHGCYDGPKSGRLRVLNNEPQLFNGLKFLFTGEFVPTYKNDLQNLIIAAGGTILVRREELQQCCCSQSSLSTTLVIYNSDAVMGLKDGPDKVSQRRVEAEGVAANSGSQVIAHTWILDSIASSALQSFTQRQGYKYPPFMS